MIETEYRKWRYVAAGELGFQPMLVLHLTALSFTEEGGGFWAFYPSLIFVEALATSFSDYKKKIIILPVDVPCEVFLKPNILYIYNPTVFFFSQILILEWKLRHDSSCMPEVA